MCYLRMRAGVLSRTSFHMGKWELANIPLKEWIIYTDVHGLLDGPSDAVCLPTH